MASAFYSLKVDESNCCLSLTLVREMFPSLLNGHFLGANEMMPQQDVQSWVMLVDAEETCWVFYA